MDTTQFRLDFPEFTDTVRYPDSMLNFWAGIAEKLVNPLVWCDMTTQAVELYVAHEITIAATNTQSGAAGGTPGTMGGVPNTKTVGQVTVGYDSTDTSEKDAGWWNLTNYGKQYFRLTQIFGAGCIQL